MTNTKKLLAFLMILGTVFAFVLSSSLAEETVPGSFTTRGERAVPVVTVLGLYNAAGNKVNPGGGSVTPNTRHSIRFTLTNESRAFSDISIRVAFFQSYDGSESDFDAARTNDLGDAFVARISDPNTINIVYATGSSASTVSWDDTHFSNTLHKIDYALTDNTYNFEVYFNMSKVASAYDDYYIGVSVDQVFNAETLSTYQSEGYYSINAYTEFDLDTTNLSIDWTLDELDDEIFTDYNGSSVQSLYTLSGLLFTIISNIDVDLEVHADTTWSGQDLDYPNDPDATVEAYLTDYPYYAQEFAIYFESSYIGNVSGTAQAFTYVWRTTEAGSNAADLALYLDLFDDNFENGVYEGAFYFDAVQYYD
jgi:hypothetical protein